MSRKVTRRPAGVSATLAAATPPTQARRPPRAGRRRRSGGDRPARAQGVAADGTSDLAQLIRDGNSQAVRALGEMGGNIGAVLASVVNFFNPAAIVSGGELAQVHEALLAGVRERVHAAPRRWRRSSSRSRARRLRRVPP
jgi:predicted NBD/HSP70 family sugar kinase